MENARVVPKDFFRARLHSLFGLWIVLFLIEHLLTNSQAALLVGEEGVGFVKAVDVIKNLPFLPFIEIFLIGVPILYHIVWGVKVLLTSKKNSVATDGSAPSLPKYERNHAYTLQRITSWILLFGLILHVGYMRFYRYPDSMRHGLTKTYFATVTRDAGLPEVARKLDVALYDSPLIEKETKWPRYLFPKTLKENQVVAVTTNFGVAELLIVRDAFRSPFKSILYTIFVLAACFHAFNGLWTFMITWGVILNAKAQRRAVKVCYVIMALIAFLGLASVWGTYWLNLKG